MGKALDPAMVAAMAAFAAKGGKVTKVATDATNGMTNRQWYLAARDGAGNMVGKPRVVRDEKPYVRVVVDHAGREFYQNEEGEWL